MEKKRLVASFLIIILAITLSSCAKKEVVDPYTSVATPTHTVYMQTSKGEIRFVLFEKEAPLTTAHFIKLIEKNTYNGLIFFRVVDSLIQGGDPKNDGSGDTGVYVKLETNPQLGHMQYSVGLAHPVDKEDKGSSQFYITKAETSNLDGKYAVFGLVVSGQDNVDSIANGDTIILMEVQKSTPDDIAAYNKIIKDYHAGTLRKQFNTRKIQNDD